MQNELEREPTLAEMEEEVLAEGREWTRQRLEQKLQERADRISQVFFPEGRTSGPVSKKRVDAGKQRRPRPGPDGLRTGEGRGTLGLSPAASLGD
jgi:hypothetical protein